MVSCYTLFWRLGTVATGAYGYTLSITMFPMFTINAIDYYVTV